MSPILPFLGVLTLMLLSLVFFTVKQQTAAVVERFGKFHSVRQSGLHLKIPLIDQISACLLYTSPSPRDLSTSRMPSSA